MRFSHLAAIFIIALSIVSTSLVAQTAVRLDSQRLNALLQRRGWIRIGIEDTAGNARINAPSGGQIQLDDKSVTIAGGAVEFAVGASGVNVNIPGQGSVTVREAVVASAGEPLVFNGRSYRGKFRVTGGRSLKIINEVMIDDWLKGVLPAEIGSDSPMEALKAQAIAGRSEAIFRLLAPPHKSDGYDFCTGVHCQAYKGIGEETPEIRKACDETLGFVLVAGGDVLNAVYHNVCGGVTAGAEEVWDSKPIPGLSPVFDKQNGGLVELTTDAAAAQFINDTGAEMFCFSGNPNYASYAKKYFRWSKSLSASEAGRKAGVGTLTDITVTERTRSGRVRKLTVQGSSGTKTFEKELNIRNVFDLWSGLFVLDVQRSGDGISSITFQGAGNGHGVGLCQHGAREIARRTGTFDQILGHYYPGAKLQKIYRP